MFAALLMGAAVVGGVIYCTPALHASLFKQDMACAAQALAERRWTAAIDAAQAALPHAADNAQHRQASAVIAQAQAAEAAARADAMQREAARRAAVKAAEAAAKAEAEYIVAADACIRGMRAFTGHDPLSFRCQLHVLAQKCPLPAAIPASSLEALLRRHPDAFTVDGGGSGARVGVATLTPHRGGKGHRVFGDFRCSAAGCAGNRTWSSGFTYCDTWQQCKACDTRTYPFAQRTLERREPGDEEERGPPHDSDRCGACCAGRRCTAALRAR
jgi:hypothetical protein